MRYSEEIYNKVFPREDEIPTVTDSAVEVPFTGDIAIDNDSTEDDITDDTVESDSELEQENYMEAINFITELISNFGFPVACVIALAVYSKNTTDKIISLTQEVTTALISSTKSIDDFKDAITNLLEKR